MCVPAGTTNNVLRLSVVIVSASTDAQLQCTFLSGFTGSAQCTVQYGTDPTYMNLPYSAESTETGTAGECQCGTEGATELLNCVLLHCVCS